MFTMLSRVREVFNYSNLSQTELAKRLDVTPQYIWKIMNKDSEPSDRVLLAIVKAFPEISETWLKTGEGEMLRPKTRESEIADIVDQMLDADPGDLRLRITKVLYGLNAEQLELLANIGRDMFGNEKQP